jgi:UDPglucose 6-dehydrogenase
VGAAREVNHNLAERLVDKISHVVSSVQNKDVGILGLAFKPNTNSVAGSSSVRLAQNLIAKGARVRAYDPVAIPEARLELNGTIHYCESAYAAAQGVDALVVGTGWPEFRAMCILACALSRGHAKKAYLRPSPVPIRVLFRPLTWRD